MRLFLRSGKRTSSRATTTLRSRPIPYECSLYDLAGFTDAAVRAANFSGSNVSQAIITTGQLKLAHLSPDDM